MTSEINNDMEVKRKLRKAYSPTDIFKMKKKMFQFEGKWAELFGTMEKKGVVFIWGDSGNGKSEFAMQFCKELCSYGKVVYNSLEEGSSDTIRKTMIRNGMDKFNRRFQLVDCEPMDEFSYRLSKHKSADFAVIDSFQHSQMNYKSYLNFKYIHKDKLIIIISHADQKQPSGRPARSVMRDAMEKIWVEGHRAFAKSRYIGSTGKYTIWPEGAERYWGE